MRPRNIGIIALTLPFLVLGVIILWDTFLNPIEQSVKPFIVVLAGQSVEPSDFFDNGEFPEGTAIEFAGSTPERFAPGENHIEMRLTRRLRSERITSTLYVLEVAQYVNVEYALPGQFLSPIDFLVNFDVSWDIPFTLEFAGELHVLEELPVGEYPIELIFNRAISVESIINVQDTTPPFGIVKDVTIPLGEEITPDIFFEELFDASPIAVLAFINQPDMFGSAEQNIQIEAIDFWGNRAVFEAVLTLLPNETPPRIEGTRDITSMIGTGIMFRQGVTAFDALGREIEFGIDSSQVDTNALGVYTAIYYAEDAWGLRTEVEITVTITSIDPDEVIRRVDVILEGLIRDDMTQRQKARVIFDWVVQNVEFAGGIGQDNVYEAAWQALQHRRGHCFVFYGISEIMLTRAGVPNMRIERIPGTPTRHRWNLINPDGLGWHHFDANQAFPGSDRYFFTSSHARMLTAVIRETVGIVEFYTYDPALYPPIVQ